MEPLPYSRAGRLFYMGINMIINNKNNTIISTIPNEVDILENDIRGQYPDVLEILLIDQTTKKIFSGLLTAINTLKKVMNIILQYYQNSLLGNADML